MLAQRIITGRFFTEEPAGCCEEQAVPHAVEGEKEVIDIPVSVSYPARLYRGIFLFAVIPVTI